MFSNTERLNSSWLTKVLVIVLFLLAFFSPRLVEIDRFVATDEGAWLYRSGDFLYALGQRDFANTYGQYHPGVLTLWVGAGALLLEFPDYYKLGQGYFSEFSGYAAFLESNGVLPYDVMVTGRVIQIVLIGLVMAVSLILLIELIGTLPTGLAFVLLAVDPFLIALSRMFHLDAMMSALILLSIVLFLIAGEFPDKRRMWLVFSGIAGGLAGLEKMTAVLIFPAMAVFLLLKESFGHRKEGKPIWTGIKNGIGDLILWGAAGLAAVFMFWPAMWVQPLGTSQALIRAAIGTTVGSIQTIGGEINITPTVFFFYNPLERSWRNYLAAFAWRTSPVILAGLISAMAAWRMSAGAWKKPEIKKFSIGMLVFSGIYLIFMTVAAKQSQKYMLPAYVMINLIAGWGLYSIPELLEKIWKGKWVSRVGAVLVTAGLLVQVGLMLPHVPYYWTYYNPLLGGSERAGKTIFVGTGEGLDLAGAYLNTKPDAEDLKVVAWYGTGCLSFFFDGEVLPLNDNLWGEKERAGLGEADYLVLYSNLWFRNKPEALLEGLTGIEPEKRIWLHGIEYARIYDVDDLPEELRGQ
ncbi:MAG: glycosyltransferase family 39 protein [Anaerolineales bacterium]|nr:glycosyltransferase family 39 protein [Anaerolineales bacterium]